MKKSKGFVYFVQEGKSGSIKIGFAKNVKTRIKSLQTGNSRDLRLLCAIEGDPSLEKSLHKKFSQFLERGEWFKPAVEIFEFVEASRDPDQSFGVHGVHPANNTVYFPIGAEVVFRGQIAHVVGLDLKGYDNEVGYDILVQDDRRFSNVGYDCLETIDGEDFDPLAVYKVRPKDQLWREEQKRLSTGRTGFTLADLIERSIEPFEESYACLIYPPQVRIRLNRLEESRIEKAKARSLR